MSIKLHSPDGTLRVSAEDFQHPKFLRCMGRVLLRSTLSRDIACLLEFDESVSSWTCQSEKFQNGFDTHRPDFVVERDYDILVIDVVTRRSPPAWIADVVRHEGYKYQAMTRGDVDHVRLKNCKDLIHYSGRDVPLGDRVRVLSALDHEGSLPLADCLSLFREIRPIDGLANMALARFISIDLDTALIGPETTVRKLPS